MVTWFRCWAARSVAVPDPGGCLPAGKAPVSVPVAKAFPCTMEVLLDDTAKGDQHAFAR
jgi:hypothetical protein